MPYGVGGAIDEARSLVGDTNAAAPLLDDATWNAFFAASNSNVGRTAVMACYALDAKFAQQPEKSVGPLRISFVPSARTYHDLARALLTNPAIMGFVAPLAGSLTDPNTGDAVPNLFTRTWP